MYAPSADQIAYGERDRLTCRHLAKIPFHPWISLQIGETGVFEYNLAPGMNHNAIIGGSAIKNRIDTRPWPIGSNLMQNIDEVSATLYGPIDGKRNVNGIAITADGGQAAVAKQQLAI